MFTSAVRLLRHHASTKTIDGKTHWPYGLTLILVVGLLVQLVARPLTQVATVAKPSPLAANPKAAAAGLTAPEWTSIQDQMRAAQYQVMWQTLDGQAPAYRAPNPAQGFDVAFALTGFTASGATAETAWHFGLRLMGYGAEALPAALAREQLRANRATVTYQWTENMLEWYHNQPTGVEHGFTLYAPPSAHDSHVALTLALDTNLLPALSTEGQVLALRAPGVGGPVVLRYDSLRVTDAVGHQLPAHFVLSSGNALSIVVDTVGAVYPLTVDPLLHTEVAILHASDWQASDLFGIAVSVSGDTLVVGALYEDGGAGNPASNAGAAYVFTRNVGGADNWGEVKILRASDLQGDDNFGSSVSVSGDMLVVGAPNEDGGAGDPANLAGAAYVFTRNAGGADNWDEVTILRASDRQAVDSFGYAVSVSGDTLVVGAPYEAGGAGNPAGAAGAVYVFTRNAGGADNWGEVKILHASDLQAGDTFGWSVSVSGDTLVVGAPYEDGGAGDPVSDTGAAYVFTRNAGGADNWGEVKILRASDMQASDWFGNVVSVSGDTLVVSAPIEDGGAGEPATNAGAVYVFARNTGGADNWGEVKILHASDLQAFDFFGVALSVSGDMLVVGANGEDGGAGNPASDAGAAYVFTRNAGGVENWGQVKILRASDLQADDWFGWSVSVSGDTLVIGAYGEDGGAGDPANNAGAAYIFVRVEGGWQEKTPLHASDLQAGDYFGFSVSMSNDTLVVGAYPEDGGAGDPAFDAGAAYVFRRNAGGAENWGEVEILRASDLQADDSFGWSVSVSGDTLVVGAPGEDGGAGDPALNAGAAYVFTRNAGGADNWGEVKILRASDRQRDDWFGHAVSVSGDTLVVGAKGENGGAGNPALSAGAAYVFTRNVGGADNWGEVKILHASDWQTADYFGQSVSMSNDTLVVGAYAEDGGAGDPMSEAGAAYVFRRNAGGADNWGEVKILRASDLQTNDYFGWSVSVSGDTLVVGAHGEDGGTGDPALNAGAAYVFTRNAGGADNWGEVKILYASDQQVDDYFGWSVSVSGNTLVVGAWGEDGGAGDPANWAGAAYVFTRNTGGADNWGEVKILHASDRQADDSFGYAVSVNGNTLVVGAVVEDGGAGDPAGNAGAAYVFGIVPTYTITPTAGLNGSITPSTPQIVNHGDDITFTITADTDYHIADVSVDGSSQGAVSSYTFTNVTADHTLTATFDINTYLITPTAGLNGSITPGTPQTVNHGDSITFTIAADTGYHIVDVGVDGASQGAVSSYTFANVVADHTLTATFALDVYTLTIATAGNGSGVVSPTVGAYTYTVGTVVTLTATANPASFFVGWSGNADCADGVVMLNMNIACTATFSTYKLFLPIILR